MKPLYSDRDYIRKVDIGSCSESYRSEFRRDYARLVHSPAFRRLEGKTQLFPVMEFDFFRNRLTHSIEVAQIAKSIALKLNDQEDVLNEQEHGKGYAIDTDLVEFAALAHDLGHPPFGHNGEKALNDLMSDSGGFEGNAQTLRILAVTEKKDGGGTGLNLTYRSLAAVLKYDRMISGPSSCSVMAAALKAGGKSSAQQVAKGYYKSEDSIVKQIKCAVLGGKQIGDGEFKTLECHIMDVADDIAYSTYDLEDALKAGFLNLIDILGANNSVLDKVTEKVAKKCPNMTVDRVSVRGDLVGLFADYELSEIKEISSIDTSRRIGDNLYDFAEIVVLIKGFVDKFSKSGAYRSKITSGLVSAAINNVELQYNSGFPEMSVVDFTPEYRRKIEVLKNFVYCSIIESPRLKVAEYRGTEMVREIFKALAGKNGHLLLPDDYKILYDEAHDDAGRKRVICDFIAGMTDRYAIEFYGRLKSENPQTIFKPF